MARSYGLGGALERRGGDVGDADGGLDLPFGHAGIGADLTLRINRDGAGLVFFRRPPSPVELLQQLPAPPHGSRLDAIGQLAQRVVVGLLGDPTGSAAGRDFIACDVRQGTRRDAILFSVGANAAHGMRRTNQDKRRAVMALLDDPEWAAWSDGEIARRCSVSAEMVRKLRPAAAISQPLGDGAPRFVSRGGATYTMNTAAIGARPPPWRSHRGAFKGTLGSSMAHARSTRALGGAGWRYAGCPGQRRDRCVTSSPPC